MAGGRVDGCVWMAGRLASEQLLPSPSCLSAAGAMQQLNWRVIGALLVHD